MTVHKSSKQAESLEYDSSTISTVVLFSTPATKLADFNILKIKLLKFKNIFYDKQPTSAAHIVCLFFLHRKVSKLQKFLP